MTRASSLGIPVWVEARKETTTSPPFCPYCARTSTFAGVRRVLEGTYDEPYDVLLDDYERGMKTAEVRGSSSI